MESAFVRRTTSGLCAAAALLMVTGGCPWLAAAPDCQPAQNAVALPRGLEEASGVAVSRAHAGIFWTHPDGSRPYLYAVDATGALRGKVRLNGAELSDWEDLEIAACGSSDCLYASDTGDNPEKRSVVHVLRMKEPSPSDTVVTVEEITMRYPNGARDSEALFVLPGERLHLVSKGTSSAVAVYRYPGALRAGGEPATLQEVQRLSPGAVSLPREVTGASAALDGSRVAVRTYEMLMLFRMDGDTLALVPDGTVNLRTLREAQGEGVGIGQNGLIALTSESGPGGGRGSMIILRCNL
jgi:hypothetical protein